MSKFRGGLQDWRRYIDERTKAVRDQQDLPEGSIGDEAALAVPTDPDHPVSEDVEAFLTRRKAIQDEIHTLAPAESAPVATVAAPAPVMAPTAVEAAALFARLPRHIQLLVRPAEGEVAQNSYKSKFTETRDDLIRRILDPQLTLEETARILNVCPTTVRRYTNRGQLAQERTAGNHRRFRLSDVLGFLEKYGAEVHD